jgi:hypothetical protein
MAAPSPTTQILIILLIVVPLLGFWFVMMRDMFGRNDLPPNARTFWLVLLLFFNVFGAALYYMNEYRGRRR